MEQESMEQENVEHGEKLLDYSENKVIGLGNIHDIPQGPKAAPIPFDDLPGKLDYPPVNTGPGSETEATPNVFDEMDAEQLREEFEKDLDILAELTGNDYDDELYGDEEITPLKVESYRFLRLIEESKYADLEPLLIGSFRAAGMPENQLQALKWVTASAKQEPDIPLWGDILTLIVRHAYKARK